MYEPIANVNFHFQDNRRLPIEPYDTLCSYVCMSVCPYVRHVGAIIKFDHM